MKIIHVSSAHPWTDNRIHYREAASLAEAGHEVILIAVKSAVDGPNVGVTVLCIPRLSRARRVVVSTLRAITLALKQNGDVYHLHDPELIWAIPLLRLLRKRVLYDAHEDLPIQVLSKSYVNSISRPALSIFAHLLVKVAGFSDGVVAATEQVASRFPSQKTTVVHNYPPLRTKELHLSPISRRPGSLVYVGGIGELRGVKVMIEALADAQMPAGWRLKMAGGMSSDLEARLSSMPGWASVDYYGLLSPDGARDLLLEAKVGFLLLQNTKAYRDSLPTKMFEYFAAGVPVVASDFPIWRGIVEQYDCGLLVDEKSAGAVANAVRRYVDDPDLLARHSVNARKAAERSLNWAPEAVALLGVYDRLSHK